jgi:hypothetical protein
MTETNGAADEQMVAARQPVLFKRLEPLDPVRHAGLKLDRATRNHRFAADVSAIPATMAEFASGGVCYPIVFTAGPQPVPVFILGYKPGENLLVDAAGTWRGGFYVPWYVRCYPFAVLDGPQPESLVPCLDAEGAGLGPLIGDLLIEDGAVTPMAKEIMQFCFGYNRALKETRELGRTLHAAGLLVQHEATIGLGGERKPARLKGFYAVDTKKFDELPDKTFLAWRKKGLLTAVFQHLHSLNCWPALSIAAIERLGNDHARNGAG